MNCYSILVFWPDCKVPEVSRVGPIPRLTLPFCTGIIRDLSLTTVPGCGWRVGWSVSLTRAHAEKRKKWLRSWGEEGKWCLRGQLIQDLYTASMPFYLPLLSWDEPNLRKCLQFLLRESLAMSKISCFLWSWGNSHVKCFQTQASFSGSQGSYLVTGGRSGLHSWLLLWEMKVNTGF